MVSTPPASRTSRGWTRKTSRIGGFAWVWVGRLRALRNTGVSSMVSRTHSPTPTRTMLSRNGMRQPQSRKAGLVSPRATLTARNVALDSAKARAGPSWGKIA
jgi:hypothetical protein